MYTHDKRRHDLPMLRCPGLPGFLSSFYHSVLFDRIGPLPTSRLVPVASKTNHIFSERSCGSPTSPMLSLAALTPLAYHLAGPKPTHGRANAVKMAAAVETSACRLPHTPAVRRFAWRCSARQPCDGPWTPPGSPLQPPAPGSRSLPPARRACGGPEHVPQHWHHGAHRRR